MNWPVFTNMIHTYRRCKVKYTFYLGGNFTNDYNIARDYSYDITFRIAGPNSADVRVEITDGNVAIFDEVDVIKNIIVDF